MLFIITYIDILLDTILICLVVVLALDAVLSWLLHNYLLLNLTNMQTGHVIFSMQSTESLNVSKYVDVIVGEDKFLTNS